MVQKQKIEIKEEDLYKPVQAYLIQQGYTVNSEVEHCDVTAVKGDALIIVELKKNINLELIIQAAKRQRMTDLVYVAVPHPEKSIFSNRWKDLCHILRRLEIGLILVSITAKSSDVRVEFHPSAFDRGKSKTKSQRKKLVLLGEIKERHGDYNTGGSTRKKLMTAYKEKAIHIACCLERFGQLKPRDLRLLGTDPKKTGDILLKNYYGWFDRLGNGFYSLNADGQKALSEYKALAELFRKDIPEVLAD